jgi:hypothetical protein
MIMLDMIKIDDMSKNGNPKIAPPTLDGNAHNIDTSMEHKF